MKRPPRILFHAINGVGLGHQRRTALIAAAARRLGATVFVVSEARRADALDELGLPSVRIPLLASVFDREIGPISRRLFRESVEAFDPDLIVHDTHFLREVVRELAVSGRRQALVLRFTTAVTLKNLLGGASAARMAAVILPYERALLNGLRLSAALLDRVDQDPRVACTGPVVEPTLVDDALGARYGLAEPTVLVSAGAGGKPGADQFYLDAMAAARGLRAHARFLFVLGPYSRLELRTEPGIRVVREEPALRALLPSFAAGVLLPGYNAIHEAMAARLPSVVRHAKGLYCEDPGPTLDWLEARGCVAVAHGRRSLRHRMRDVISDPIRRRRMADAWPIVVPAAEAAANKLLVAAQEIG